LKTIPRTPSPYQLFPEKSVRLLGLFLVLGLIVPGCIRYHPKPIVPSNLLADFEARKLDSPEVGNFLRAKAAIAEWPPKTWDLRALTLAAFFYNPDLDIVRAQWSAALAGRVTAGERPNPTISGLLGYNSTTPASEITPWIPEIAFEIPIETAGKRGYRILGARNLSEAARLNILSAAWDIRARVRQAFLGLYGAREKGILLQRQLDGQEETVHILEAQVRVGEAAPFDLAQARIARDNTRLAQLDAAAALVAARFDLALAVGVPSAAFDSVVLDFDGWTDFKLDVPPNEVRRRALISRSDILSSLAEYDAAQAALRVEIARQYPDLSLAPDYQLDQTDSKWTLGLSLILPLLSRNKGPIAEAAARRSEAAARFQSLQASVIAEVETTLAAARAAQAKVLAADAMLASLRKEESVARSRFKVGEISKLELLAVELELASNSLARLEALVQAQQAVGDLEKAVQAPLEVKPWVLETPDRTGGRMKEHSHD
jgi:cobalt-zinc-cadmium efflux system outer membrane protein